MLKRPLEQADKMTLLTGLAAALIWLYFRGRKYV